ncbi:uncharacterized protein LOC124269082 [Haliotis rubra]|uniref:uncharacterized protein LOC124269082 n=1 Tax=Haliotis rubra TaxID=36100 RepID=UPI001EE5D92C|nr:uncharacterized protein LOC124269082 [Haliotis rubra]
MYGIYHDNPLELRDPRGRRVKERKRRERQRKLEAIQRDDDSDDGLYHSSLLDGLDLDGVLGQQLVMWSYKDPDTLNLYTPVISDDLSTILRLTKETLQYDQRIHKLMMLKPGTNHPMDISQFYKVESGAAILIMPKELVKVNIEIKQLNMKFEMEVELFMTVLQLKFRLQQERGLAMERLDLLFKDQPLENRQYLFNYRIGKSSTIFVMVHILYDMLVHVETFWGSTYHLYLDPCMTGMNVIWTVLRRTVTKNTPDIMALFDLYLPKHTLVLYHKRKVVNWSTCLGYYRVDDNDTLKLSTIGLYHKLSVQKMPITDDAGKVHTVKVSQFDRWSTVALKLHGIIGVSVNLIRIFRGGKEVDFSETLKKQTYRTPAITMDLSLSNADPDVLYGVSLKFKLGDDVTEILKVSSKRSVRSVKAILEQLGVPNASVYDMYLGDYKLSNRERIVTAVEDLRTHVNLKLTQYPVFIHTTQNVIYKMHAYAQETVAAFKKRVEMKSGLSLSNYKLTLAGEEFDEGDELAVFDTRIGIKSSLFLRPRLYCDVFFILYDNYLLKVKVPPKPKARDIKQLLWKEMALPSGALASVGTFLQWYYTGRSSPTFAHGGRRAGAPRGYHFVDPSAALQPRQVEDYEDLQDDIRQMHRRKEDFEQTYPYKPEKAESDPVMKMFNEKERLFDRLKGRSFSYPAKLFPSYESVKQKNKHARKHKGHGSADDYERKRLKRRAHGQPRWFNSFDKRRNKKLMAPRSQEEIYHLRKLMVNA